jgi:hypothetical protein
LLIEEWNNLPTEIKIIVQAVCTYAKRKASVLFSSCDTVG